MKGKKKIILIAIIAGIVLLVGVVLLVCRPYFVSSIQITGEKYEFLSEGDNISLGYKIEPIIGKDKVVWESSDTNILVVNNGNVEAVGPGEATITVKTKKGKAQDSITYKVANIYGNWEFVLMHASKYGDWDESKFDQLGCDVPSIKFNETSFKFSTSITDDDSGEWSFKELKSEAMAYILEGNTSNYVVIVEGDKMLLVVSDDIYFIFQRK